MVLISETLNPLNRPNCQVLIVSPHVETSLVVTGLVVFILASMASAHIITFANEAHTFYFSCGFYAAGTFLFLLNILKYILEYVMLNRHLIHMRKKGHFDPHTLSPKHILKVIFENNCLKTTPCQHICTIQLITGKTIRTHLWGHEAHLLIQTIGSNRCRFKGYNTHKPEEHFIFFSSQCDDLSINNILARARVSKA